MNKVKVLITSIRPLSVFAALVVVPVSSLSTATAAVTINSIVVNDLGNSSSPSISLTSLGATDWLALNSSGAFGSPAVYDEKSGGVALTFVGSTQLFGGGNTASYNANWTDGTTTASYSGGTGYYIFSGNASTQTFTASISAGATSTISFYSLSWVPNGASFVVKDSANNSLSTLSLPSLYDNRTSIVLNYTSNIDDTLTFQYSLAGGTSQQLGVAAVALTTVPEPSTWLAGMLTASVGLFLTFRRINGRPI